uniref:Uncharacterized protein n=1 Tax=Rhizophora mucronata TaxID=61149 RepID=A0A2P2PGZ1_RHIMU
MFLFCFCSIFWFGFLYILSTTLLSKI